MKNKKYYYSFRTDMPALHEVHDCGCEKLKFSCHNIFLGSFGSQRQALQFARLHYGDCASCLHCFQR